PLPFPTNSRPTSGPSSRDAGSALERRGCCRRKLRGRTDRVALVLVGRHRELTLMDERIARSRSLALVGTAGVGKTALLREAARTSGRNVFEGGALANLAWMSFLPLARALGEADVELLDLEELSGEDATRLIRSEHPDLDQDSLAQILREAGGNPFLLAELAASPEPSPTLRLALRARLDRCSTDAHRSM